ncbi:MAG TPA: TadE family type IV pilus minor pilin, partial [Mycobacteriales bacterium]|nr:TadE family type IV pilus minor pilin [Mycobacteriales bacterium]
LAVALPALMLAGLLATAGLQVAVAQLRCLDAAGIAARLAARGELAIDVESAATAAGPRQSRVTVAHDGDVVSAMVAAPVHLLGLGGLLPSFQVIASAADPVEPGAGGG